VIQVLAQVVAKAGTVMGKLVVSLLYFICHIFVHRFPPPCDLLTLLSSHCSAPSLSTLDLCLYYDDFCNNNQNSYKNAIFTLIFIIIIIIIITTLKTVANIIATLLCG